MKKNNESKVAQCQDVIISQLKRCRHHIKNKCTSQHVCSSTVCTLSAPFSPEIVHSGPADGSVVKSLPENLKFSSSTHVTLEPLTPAPGDRRSLLTSSGTHTQLADRQQKQISAAATAAAILSVLCCFELKEGDNTWNARLKRWLDRHS